MIAEDLGASRISYHRDGTVGRFLPTSTVYVNGSFYSRTPDGWREIPDLGLAGLNSLVGAALAPAAPYSLQVLFPVPTDIKGILPVFAHGEIRTSALPYEYFPRILPVKIEYSTNTLGGDDGTWQTLMTTPQYFAPEKEIDGYVYRMISPFLTGQVVPTSLTMSTLEDDWANPYVSYTTLGNEIDVRALTEHTFVSGTDPGVWPVDISKVRGLRLTPQAPTVPSGYFDSTGSSLRLMHTRLLLWGGPSTGHSDFLQVEDATLSREVKHEADWGTFPPHSSADRKIRVRNRSSERTAERIVVTTEDPSGIPHPYRGMFLLSLDGKKWAETITLYTMSPGAVSPTIHVRRVTGIEFPEGVGEVFLYAEVGRWVDAVS